MGRFLDFKEGVEMSAKFEYHTEAIGSLIQERKDDYHQFKNEVQRIYLQE